MMARQDFRQLNRKSKIFVAVMLILPITNLLIFWLYVNFNAIILAFQTNNFDGTLSWNFKNFEMLFREFTIRDSSIVMSLKNTMIFFASNIFVVLPICLLLCYFLYKRIAGYKFFRFVFYIPSIISASVLVVLFKYLIAPNGLVGALSEVFGQEAISYLTDSKYALGTILFYTITMSFGGNLILLSGAMSHIPESIVEAAKIDGIGMTREIFQIVIPLIWPTLTTLIIFAFVGIFSSSGPILLFTQGDYKTNTLSFWIYSQVYYAGEYNYPAAVGIVMTVVATPIVLVIRYFLNKTLDVVEVG